MFIAQAHPAPREVLGLGIGQDNAAIPGQKKNSKTTGGGDRTEGVGCCHRPGEEVLDRGRSLEMRRKGFQELPLLGFHTNRVGRSLEREKFQGGGGAPKANADDIGHSLRPAKFVKKSRGFERIALGDVRTFPQRAWS
jgi:hypothetical protein